jgi:ABC-type multidrug transport system fused ATPase/permease subunit
MKSLTETNSGKLIALISADIFQVERAVTMTPYILACPFVLILTLFYIGMGSGWEYAGYTLAIWLLTIGGQMVCNRITMKLKMKEAVLNDSRIKLINDLVTGIRTIKCYAWENHYIKKIKETRAA